MFFPTFITFELSRIVENKSQNTKNILQENRNVILFIWAFAVLLSEVFDSVLGVLSWTV